MPKVLASKNAGNYEVALTEEDGEYELAIRFTGNWASGQIVAVPLEVADREDATDAKMRAWFRSHLRGDMQVQGVLASGGYDVFTNRMGPSRAFLVHAAWY
jgi:hypothetical protein